MSASDQFMGCSDETLRRRMKYRERELDDLQTSTAQRKTLQIQIDDLQAEIKRRAMKNAVLSD